MARLGTLYQITSGGTPSRKFPEYYENGSILWVKTGDLKEKYLFDTEEKITQAGLDNSSAKIYPPDTVLIAMYGATIGATSILKIHAATNQACAAFIKRDDILPEYLYSFLQSQQSRFEKEAVGGAQPNISAGYLKQIEIPIPTFEKQTEIVEILGTVDVMIKKRKKQLLKLDELVKARFVEMFGDPTTNPMEYPVKFLNDIAEYYNGLTYKPENVSDIGTIVLRSSNIQNSQLDFEDTVRVDCPIRNKLWVKENDILMCSRNGSTRLVGKVALIKNISEPMTFGAFMMIIRSPYYRYLMTYFQMDAFRAQIKTGATTTINQITGKMLDDVKLPIPDMESVAVFSAFVEQTDKLKSQVEQSLEKLETLKKALMQKYFG